MVFRADEIDYDEETFRAEATCRPDRGSAPTARHRKAPKAVSPSVALSVSSVVVTRSVLHVQIRWTCLYGQFYWT